MSAELERYNFAERMCHWSAAATYLYCMFSGLALYSPYLFWIAAAMGGAPQARYWHPWSGLGFVIVALWMHWMWSRAMKLTETDRKWMKQIEAYATNQDEKLPAVGRFNAGQKEFYWAMYYGAGLLLLSGVVMWFPEAIPFRLHLVRAIAVVIHECAALVTIGGLIVHVYMGLFAVPGSLHAIVRGTVSREWAMTHHRNWYRRLVGEPVPEE